LWTVLRIHTSTGSSGETARRQNDSYIPARIGAVGKIALTGIDDDLRGPLLPVARILRGSRPTCMDDCTAKEWERTEDAHY